MKRRPLLFRLSALSAIGVIFLPFSILGATGPGLFVDGGSQQVSGGSSGIIDGGETTGYFVKSGSLTISNATVQNFTTTGGAGSGGGAGLGGAVFVNTGATVVLNNVSFTGNTVIGGTGGVGTTGGSLNNRFNGGTTIGQAASGYTPNDTHFIDVNGTTGTKGMNGANNANGIGAAGGNGGNGGNGGDRSESLILAVTAAAVDVADVAIQIAAASSNPFTANVAIGLAPSVISAGINLGSATAELVYFDKALSEGHIGLGGGAGAGGSGGAGGFGYGGGTGGDGGNGGTGGSNWSGSAYSGGAAGGDAGDGGSGGIGGFGAGGGKGGDGGNGGGGAGIAARAETPATEDVYKVDIVPARYAKGYYAIPGNTSSWVEIEGGLSAPITTVANYDHDSNPMTPGVTLESIETSPRTEIRYLETPGTPAIAASEGGSRPNGADGSGGDGGKGGFGAGAGSAGDGSANGDGGTGGNGYGGAIFVRDGGTLIVRGNALFDRNATSGGSSLNGGAAGEDAGADLFIMRGSTVILDAGINNTIVFNGGIADDSAASISGASIRSGDGAGLDIQSGLVIFNGENTYTGVTKISGGVLQTQDGYGIHRNSNINLAGGVLQSNGLFNRYLGTGSDRLQWTASGGFSAVDGDLTVRLNQGQQLTWGSGNFVGSGNGLVFGSTSATDDVTFVNAINLGSGTRSVLAASNGDSSNNAIMTGVLSGTGILAVNDATHDGKVILTAQNTYSGGTIINNGTLSLENGGSLNSNGSMVVNEDGTFDISKGGNQSIGTLAGAGNVKLGTNTLTLNQGSNTEFSGVISDSPAAGGVGPGTLPEPSTAGNVTKNGSGTLTLSGDNTYTGTTQINAGGIIVSGTLQSQLINVEEGTFLSIMNSGLSATAVLNNYGVINLWSNDVVGTLNNVGVINTNGFTLTASIYELTDGTEVTGHLGTGTVNSNGTVQVNSTSEASAFNVQTGVTTLGSGERLLDTVDLTISAGAELVLGGEETIGSLFGGGLLTNSGFRLLVDDGSFSGDIAGSGGLFKQSTGVLEINSAQSYTGGTVIDYGTLALKGDGSLVSTQPVTVNANGDFDISQSGDQEIGTLSGAGKVSLGEHTLTINESSATTFSGLIRDGGIGGGVGGGITKEGAATLELSGESTYTGITQINAGAINLTGSLQSGTVNVSAGTQLTVENGGLSTATNLVNDGTVVLGSADDTIASYTATGLLNTGDNTLTAVTYALNDGSETNGKLGTGTINANGNVELNATSQAATVNIESGTTHLGDEERLLDTVALTINAEATIVLGGDEKIGSLNGSGILDTRGSNLTVDSGLFSGDITDYRSYLRAIPTHGSLTKVSNGTLSITSDLSYTGATHIKAGTLDLSGSLASDDITIDAGASLVSSNAGINTSAVITNNGTLDITGVNQTISVLDNTGTVDGTATLTAGEYNLGGGSEINANLGAGIVTVTNGTSVLNGTSGAATVNVEVGGTLTLGSANLLSDLAVVTVDGTMNLGGIETIYQLFGAGTINLNTFSLIVTNGGLFTGILNAGDTDVISDGGDLDFDGGIVNTENVDVTNGGSVSIGNGAVVTTNTTNVNDGSTLNVDGTSSLNSNTITVNGTVSLGSGAVLNYDTLHGAGFVETNGSEFVNEDGSKVAGNLTFSDDVRNEGSMAPGNSPGTTTVLGNYTEAGVYEAEIENTLAGGFDQIRVGNTLTLDPSSALVVQTFNGNVPAFGDLYQIFSDLAGDSIRSNGAFGSVSFDADGVAGAGAAVNNAAVIYDVETSEVIATGLNAADSTFGQLGSNDNEARAAEAIFAAATAAVGQNQIDSSDPVLGTIVRDLFTNGLGAAGNLARFTPDYYGAMADYAFAGNAALTSHLRSRVTAPSSAKGDVYGGWNNHNFDTADSVDVNRNDAYVGGDYLVAPGVKVGGTFTYNDGELNSKLGDGDVDGYGLSAYATADVYKNVSVFGLIGYSDQDFDLERTTQQGQVDASTDVSSFVLNAGARYLAYEKNELSVAPYLVLGYEQASADSFSEEGAVDALRHGGYDASRFTADLGVSGQWSTKIADRAFTVEAILGLRQIISDDQDDMTATLIANPAASYSVSYADDDSTLINVGLNLGYEVTKGGSVYAGYEGLIGGESSNKFNLGYRHSF